ncbi:MAG: O-succinylhomoserine sulfhydrylase [Gammaproteobacteria bacterium]|nr:O-succinylhomoserine sulfhydrylase [Gammaproteobacteria bacterium]
MNKPPQVTGLPAGSAEEFGFDTRAVRAGQVRTAELEHNDPIFLSSSFVFENAAQAAARFAETEPGNVYSRFTNPTVRAFEERLASLEGGNFCVATGSGMSAILSTCLALLKAGDHVVAAHDLFGASISLFNNILSKFGIRFSFVRVTDIAAWKDAVTPDTRMVFIESPTNPLGEVADLDALSRLAHDNDALFVVDNCLCTPVLQRPFDYGADVVIHSATKYIDGHGRCVGGAVVVKDEELRKELFGFLRTAGPSMSPFNAWVFLKGLESLNLRMRACSASALDLARWLESHPAVDRVYYPGLKSHPQHRLARKQQSAYGGIVAFEIRGGRPEAWQVIDATRFLSITANLGDAKTTITHPASTTHGRLTQAQRDAAGIRDSLVRVAVGLEDPADIRADLAIGLDALAAGALAKTASG